MKADTHCSVGSARLSGVWGGTLLQWLVPFLLAAYFFYHRQFASFIFCTFFFFENWIYTATYMADARAMVLQLVTLGDPEFAKHDWNTIFGNLGLLDYDTRIGAVVRFLGWAGMLTCTAWLVSRLRKPSEELDPSSRLRKDFNRRERKIRRGIQAFHPLTLSLRSLRSLRLKSLVSATQSLPSARFAIMTGCVQASGLHWTAAKKRIYGYRYRHAPDGRIHR